MCQVQNETIFTSTVIEIYCSQFLKDDFSKYVKNLKTVIYFHSQVLSLGIHSREKSLSCWSTTE